MIRIIQLILRCIRAVIRRYYSICYKYTFKEFGQKSSIIKPLSIDGRENISIGNHVFIAYKTWLAALPLTGEDKCNLVIKDNCTIGHFNHIYCTKSIILEEGVLTADKVYISDNLHGYMDVHTYIKNQPIIQKKEVIIGEGTWLGENVCVLGCKVGKQCVIGSNSVITKDIPDYCVAVGAPARIIKRYDFATQSWRKTNPKGEFID